MIAQRNQLLYTTLIAYISLLLVGTIKGYLLVVLLYALFLFLRLNYAFVETLFFVLLFTLPIEKGLRGWMIPVVDSGPELWMQGYAFYFGLTVKVILATVLALVLPRVKVRGFFTNAHVSLLLFLFLSAVSTLRAPNIPIALLGFVRLFQAALIFFAARHLFSEQKYRALGKEFFVACLLFFGSFGVWQLLFGRPLGFYFEDVLGRWPYGARTTDGVALYRISGFFGHPTFFGSFLSLLLPVGLGVFLQTTYVLRRYWLLLSWSIIAGTVSLVATFSRSGWFAMLVSTPWMIWRSFRMFGAQRLKPFMSIVAVTVVAIAVFLGVSVAIRAESFSQALSLDSGRVRLQLLEQAMIMIRTSPLWGVGLNHFTRVLSTMNIPENIAGFLYPVHNTFALFASEVGVPAAGSFIVFVFLVMKASLRKASASLTRFGVWLGALTFIINAQFHALFNQDPTFDLFMVFLGYLAAL